VFTSNKLLYLGNGVR